MMAWETSLLAGNLFIVDKQLLSLCIYKANQTPRRYSPIGRGMLSGEIKSPDDIPEGDMRRNMPRFHSENFAVNMELVKAVGDIAAKKGCTSAQLALAWVRTLSKRNGNPEIIPIPGATTEARVKENSVNLTLEESEMQELDEVVGKFRVVGGRYSKMAEAWLEG